MKRIALLVSNETFQRLMQNGGQRTPGRIWLECDGGTQPEFMYEPYSPRQQKRKCDQLLLSTEHGWLKKSSKRYKMHLSVPDHLGEQQTARVMERESKHLVDFMADLEQFLNNV